MFRQGKHDESVYLRSFKFALGPRGNYSLSLREEGWPAMEYISWMIKKMVNVVYEDVGDTIPKLIYQ